MNITLDIDDDIVEKAGKVAADKNTTLTAMVRDYLTSLASAEVSALDAVPHEKTAGEQVADKFRESVRQLSRPMGPRNWTRDDLYDRPYAYFKRD